MNKEYIIKTLKKVDLFSSLKDEELYEITGKMIIKRFKKNQIILIAKDTNEYMYIILDGEVKAVQTTEKGKELILAIHGSGDFFGEMSLLDGRTTPARIMATKDSITAIISRENFFSLIGNNKVLTRLLQILCLRFRESLRLINILSFSNSSQRIKMLFIMLSRKYGKKEKNGVILNLKLTHQAIAEMSGLTRETVTRVIDRLKKDKEITVFKNRFIYLTPKFFKDIKY